MLRKFRVRLNDKEYMVEMEELTRGFEAPAAQEAPAQAVPAPAPSQAPAEAASEPSPAPAPASQPGSGEEVTAPMPGTILNVLLQPGETVAESQAVVVLDAMKMENQIVAPKAGQVTSILVKEGQTVDVGETLFTVE